MDLLSHALGELAAAQQRPYLDDADADAATTYYADVDGDADGRALFAALARLLEATHEQQPRYSPASELYPWIDLQPDRKIRSLYTNEEYDPRELIEDAARIQERRQATRASLMAGRSGDHEAVEAAVEELEPYNCEHTVCQSWFEHDEPMRGDLHHLFTCERRCNSFRGNAPFTDYEDYLEVVRERCGKLEKAGFEPAAGKGAAARGTLYFLLRYPTPPLYTEEAVTMLLGWHESAPVTDYERHRNAAIFERQGNRNPVIDHPDWATRIDFTARVLL